MSRFCFVERIRLYLGGITYYMTTYPFFVVSRHIIFPIGRSLVLLLCCATFFRIFFFFSRVFFSSPARLKKTRRFRFFFFSMISAVYSRIPPRIPPHPARSPFSGPACRWLKRERKNAPLCPALQEVRRVFSEQSQRQHAQIVSQVGVALFPRLRFRPIYYDCVSVV